MEVYKVKGELKEHFFDEQYIKFEKEVNTDKLIEMIRDSKVIVNEVIRKTIVNE